jgi:hypothetical protein
MRIAQGFDTDVAEPPGAGDPGGVQERREMRRTGHCIEVRQIQVAENRTGCVNLNAAIRWRRLSTVLLSQDPS